MTLEQEIFKLLVSAEEPKGYDTDSEFLSELIKSQAVIVANWHKKELIEELEGLRFNIEDAAELFEDVLDEAESAINLRIEDIKLKK